MSWAMLTVVGCVWLWDAARGWELRKRLSELESLMRADRDQRGLP